MQGRTIAADGQITLTAVAGLAETGTNVYFHREPVVTRLAKLADADRTGVLRLSGDFGGAIYLREGDVVYAESKRTPGPARWFANLSEPLGEAEVISPSDEPVRPRTGRPGGAGPAATANPEAFSLLERSVVVTEATIDAAWELLSNNSRYTSRQRFRPSEAPEVGNTPVMTVERLLAEVNRRERILKQLSAFVTADSTIVRNPNINSRGVRVSALQWAMLVRVGERSTPRGLALDLGRSVFSTTIEVFRLVVLRLLAVIDAPVPPVSRASDGSLDRRQITPSFLRAVSQ